MIAVRPLSIAVLLVAEPQLPRHHGFSNLVLVRVSLLTGVIMALFFAFAAMLAVFGSTVFGSVGGIVTRAGWAVAFVPALFVLQLAFIDAVLEGTGARSSIGKAMRRTLGSGARMRTVKLAYAAAVFTAILTLDAVDYRIRNEGADFEPVLDAAEPA